MTGVYSGLPARARAWMAVFMGAMTAFWSVNLLAAAPVAGILGMAVGVAIIIAGILRQVRPTATVPDSSQADRRRADRVFTSAVVAEVVVAVAAIGWLLGTGRPQFVMATVALIVALHFLLFLRAQRHWWHAVAGIVGSVASAVAIVLLATGRIDADTSRALAGGALALCTTGYGLAAVVAPRRR